MALDRIASLSHPGIHVLQQRLVWHNTRLTLSLANFREQSAPILAEAEMQELWIDTVLGDAEPTAAAVEAAGVEFQYWLSEGDNKIRLELDSEANHARLRRETRAVATQRRERDT